jgi:hypothetical protein
VPNIAVSTFWAVNAASLRYTSTPWPISMRTKSSSRVVCGPPSSTNMRWLPGVSAATFSCLAWK